MQHRLCYKKTCVEFDRSRFGNQSIVDKNGECIGVMAYNGILWRLRAY